MIRPEAGAARLYDRPSRVTESSSTTTSWPSSTRRLARSLASSAAAGGARRGRARGAAELGRGLGPLDGRLGDRGVVLRRPVERGRDDLALDRALHVGDLFGPLVDQHAHQVALGGVMRGGAALPHALLSAALAGAPTRPPPPPPCRSA